MKLVRGSVGASLIAVASLGMAASAKAGPIELFYSAAVDPTSPDEIVAPYMYGGGGMFISNNAGKDFKMLCTSQIDPKVERDTASTLLNAGSIYIGVFDGLWRGDKNGCNFAAVPELQDHFVSAVTADPMDPKRTYVVTSDGTPKLNGIYVNDAAAGPTFTALGTQESLFVNTLHVVKVGSGRRYYETGVKNDAQTNSVSYSVRVSNDDAKTWTEHPYDIAQYGPMDMFADFDIVAIDPTNPDRVIARVKRDMMVDTVLESTDQGKTFSMIAATINDAQAITFTPDGKLYIGDNDQSSKQLFLVEKAGDAPKMLMKDLWKVGCLQWDQAHNRMLACNDFRFGTADLTSGEFTALMDMECAPSFVECPGAMPGHDVCETQLLAAYCGVTHYPIAPLCAGYDQGPGAAEFIAMLGYTCVDGFRHVTPDGAAGMSIAAAGSSGAAAVGAAGMSMSMPGSAGTGATSAAGGGAVGAGGAGSAVPATGGSGTPEAPAAPKSSSGCAIVSAAGASAPHALWLGLFGVLGTALVWRRRRP